MFDLDLNEHLKILFVALSAVAIVIAVGLHAETERASLIDHQPNGVYLPGPVKDQPTPLSRPSPMRIAHP